MNGKPTETRDEAIGWPAWANWALVAILVSAIATIAATLNDIW